MSPERFARINEMLDNRQPDLTVLLDQVHKTNNIAAVLRSADAVGVHQLHAVWPESAMRVSGNTASGSQQWVKTLRHATVTDAITALKADGMQVVVTNFSANAKDFREIDYTRPTAIVLGHEKNGVSDEAVRLADAEVIIPMVGMVQSLNVSVAGALVLFEAERQRRAAGMYGSRKLDDAYCQKLLFEQGHPIYAKACRRKGLAYPAIDETGQIIAQPEWWQKMREADPESPRPERGRQRRM